MKILKNIILAIIPVILLSTNYVYASDDDHNHKEHKTKHRGQVHDKQDEHKSHEGHDHDKHDENKKKESHDGHKH